MHSCVDEEKNQLRVLQRHPQTCQAYPRGRSSPRAPPAPWIPLREPALEALSRACRGELGVSPGSRLVHPLPLQMYCEDRHEQKWRPCHVLAESVAEPAVRMSLVQQARLPGLAPGRRKGLRHSRFSPDLAFLTDTGTKPAAALWGAAGVTCGKTKDGARAGQPPRGPRTSNSSSLLWTKLHQAHSACPRAVLHSTRRAETAVHPAGPGFRCEPSPLTPRTPLRHPDSVTCPLGHVRVPGQISARELLLFPPRASKARSFTQALGPRQADVWEGEIRVPAFFSAWGKPVSQHRLLRRPSFLCWSVTSVPEQPTADVVSPDCLAPGSCQSPCLGYYRFGTCLGILFCEVSSFVVCASSLASWGLHGSTHLIMMNVAGS